MVGFLPLAVGLVAHEPHPSREVRQQLAVRLGAFAAQEGYAVAYVLELTGAPVRDGSVLDARDVVRRTEARLLLLHGSATGGVIALAEQCGLTIVRVP